MPRVLALVLRIVGSYAGAILLIAAVVPERVWVDSPLSTAWHQALPHHQCSMCGLTRSFSAMAHRHLATACSYNARGPAIFIGFSIVFLLMVGQLMVAWLARPSHTPPRSGP